MERIEEMLNWQAQATHDDIRFLRFRGDAWQCYCRDGAQGFRLTLLVLAELRARPMLPASRIAVAIGPAEPMPKYGLGSATGEAFTLSGLALDAMNSRERLVFTTADQGQHPWQAALFSFLGWAATRWSPEQAEALSIAFRYNPPRPRDVVNALGISRQAASSRLKGAAYAPLLDAVRAFDLLVTANA